MKSRIALLIAGLAAAPLFAADPTPADRAAAAIERLRASTNYSWTTTIALPGMPFTPGPVNGRTENGASLVSQEFNDNTIQVAFKGARVAVKGENGWETIDAADDFAAMMAGFLANPGTVADEAEQSLKKLKNLKAGDGGELSGDYTDDGAKELLWFKPRRGDAPPAPKNAKGSAKFWIKDGALVKFESHLHGTVAFGPDQEEREMDLTRTTDVKDVGRTKLEMPDDARKKLEAR